MYLIDTCVWVDFLRGKENAHVKLLEELLKSGDAFVNEIIFSEICFGASNKKQFEQYHSKFSSLPFRYLPAGWDTELAKMGYSMKSAGFKPFIADLLIALTAISSDMILLTKDRDFDVMEKLFGLRVERI